MTDASSLLDAPITAARAALDDGTVSALELTRAALARIDARNDHLEALSHVAHDSALAAAAAADERRSAGRPLGLLDGIPIAVKDLLAVDGMPLEAGSAKLRGDVARGDAAVVSRLKRAGAVIVGKASLDEFALTTIGPARNPVDDEHAVGGSSGGSAAAVAAGFAFAAIGTDTGGSVRIPAECTATVGFKPTHGLLAAEGVIGLAPSLDHLGVLARTVDDARILFEAMLFAGDSGPRPEPVEAARTSPWRFGVPRELGAYADGVVARFEEATGQLVAQGVELVEVELPAFDELGRTHWAILAGEIAAYHHAKYGDASDGYGRPMLDTIAGGASISVADYLAAQRHRGELRRRVDGLLADVDVLALPTMIVEPGVYGEQTLRVAGVDEDATAAMVRGTSLFNHTGHPALSVPPAGRSVPAPAGVQLVARHFDEATLLAAAALVEGSAHA